MKKNRMAGNQMKSQEIGMSSEHNVSENNEILKEQPLKSKSRRMQKRV